jgi:hypothetical protein
MGHNAILNACGNRTPDVRTDDEHPLIVVATWFSPRSWGLARKASFRSRKVASSSGPNLTPPISGKRQKLADVEYSGALGDLFAEAAE